MKIALHVPQWPPSGMANGIVTYASQLVPALRNMGHEVFILSYGDHDAPYLIDLKRFADPSTLWSRSLHTISPARALFRSAANPLAVAIRDLNRSHRIDVFETEETGGWSYLVSRLKLLPVVVRLHGPWCIANKFDSENHDGIFRHRIAWEGRAMRHAELVTAPSNSTLEEVSAFYSLNLFNCQKISNPLSASSLRDRWNLNICDRDRILFVGRFDAPKGGDLVLQAFYHLACRNQRLNLTFVGPDVGVRIGKNVNRFEHYISNNFPSWYRSRIDFRGEMNREELRSLRQQHYVTVVASQFESFSYTTLEALSFGCPVVATAVGGITELIQNEKNGLLVPSQNVDALYSALQRLFDSPDLAAELGCRAWDQCNHTYNPAKIAAQTVEAYGVAIEKFRSKTC